MMGNRGGRLHRADFTLAAARWKTRAWIACRTEFRGRHRTVMGDGYTEIFFLDEATALAAGHRPCFECRRADASAFAAAWGRAQGSAPPAAPAMDRILHAERTGQPERHRVRELPAHTIFRTQDAYLLATPEGALPWSFAGYGPPKDLPSDTLVEAITPFHIRAAIAAGYRPRLHPSAESQLRAR